MKDFFISYNRADRGWAEWIDWELRQAGYTTFIQARDFRPGANWAVEMQRGAAEAERTIAVLSQEYLAANFTLPELFAAFAQDPKGEKRTLIPVRVGECELTGLLRTIIYIDLVGRDEAAARTALISGVRQEPAEDEPGNAPIFPGKATAPITESPAAEQRAAGPPAFPGAPGASRRVALLYKRNAPHADYLLDLLAAGLTARGHTIFIDRHLTIGLDWARRIGEEVRAADAVVPLLSAESIWSETLEDEIRTANDAAQQTGRPRLLPVRVRFTGPLPEPLAVILDRLQYTLWNGPEDDARLLAEILGALEQPPPAPPPPRLEPVKGAVPLDSRYYVVRDADREFAEAIAQQESILLIKGARQIGKTSLLARGLQQAREADATVLLTDLQGINNASFETLDAFYLALAEALADQFDPPLNPRPEWSADRPANRNFETFIRRQVLGAAAGAVVWGLDEVDRLFAYPFRNEVFGLFRAWYNLRATNPTAPWSRLTLAIAYATEAHLFISDLNQSPFNVGTEITLEDFSPEHIEDLNRRHGGPLPDADAGKRFRALLGGHPYLVRRGLREMVARGMDIAALEAQATREDGPFGDHLHRILVLLSEDAALTEIVRGVLEGKPCPTAESFFRLRGAGIIAGESARDARFRCHLYAAYLRRHLLER